MRVNKKGSQSINNTQDIKAAETIISGILRSTVENLSNERNNDIKYIWYYEVSYIFIICVRCGFNEEEIRMLE